MTYKIKSITEVRYGEDCSMLKLEIWNRQKAMSEEKNYLSEGTQNLGYL